MKRIGINLAGRTAIGKSAEGYYRHQLYIYSSDGTRIGKTVNGRTKNYLWDGGKLLSQTLGSDTQVFLYHGDSRVALEFMGQLYYYVYNLQGDVVGLVDKTGTTMVTYKYDVWGKPESTTGPMATTLGVANPFRYRGYYYDTESGFYYLQSRYYDPEVGRFLNADAYLNSGHMLGTNAYVYCYNNPVMYADYTGCIPEWLYAVAAAAAAADGPLPFGDLLLVGVCVAGAVSALSALPQIEAPERHLTEIIPFPNQNNNNNKKKQEGPAPLIPPITAPRPKEEKRPKYPDEIYAANAAYPGAYVYLQEPLTLEKAFMRIAAGLDVWVPTQLSAKAMAMGMGRNQYTGPEQNGYDNAWHYHPGRGSTRSYSHIFYGDTNVYWINF